MHYKVVDTGFQLGGRGACMEYVPVPLLLDFATLHVIVCATSTSPQQV